MDSPPSLRVATSKLVRVRVEGFSKRSPTIFPLSVERDLPALIDALIVFARARTLSISGFDASETDKKLFNLVSLDWSLAEVLVVEVHVTSWSTNLLEGEDHGTVGGSRLWLHACSDKSLADVVGEKSGPFRSQLVHERDSPPLILVLLVVLEEVGVG